MTPFDRIDSTEFTETWELQLNLHLPDSMHQNCSHNRNIVFRRSVGHAMEHSVYRFKSLH